MDFRVRNHKGHRYAFCKWVGGIKFVDFAGTGRVEDWDRAALGVRAIGGVTEGIGKGVRRGGERPDG